MLGARKHGRTFRRNVSVEGIDRMLLAGDYRVVTEDDLIESFRSQSIRERRRWFFVPASTHGASWIEMATIDPLDLRAALDRGAAP